MYFCYVDESGDFAPLPSTTTDLQPAIVIVGIILDSRSVHDLTVDFVKLKQHLFPALRPAGSNFQDWILDEVKGNEIRRDIALGNRNERRGAIRFIDKSIDLLERHAVQLVGRVWIKGIGAPIDQHAIYTSSIQAICADFQHFLQSKDTCGMVIADNRSASKNTKVAHSIFTQKFKAAGDGYNRILEMPTFGVSDNHAGIQIADMLCSAMLYPMAMDAYCSGHITSIHVRPGYDVMRPRWGDRVRKLQYQYQDGTGKVRGGFVVSDSLTQRHSGHLLRK